MSSKFLPFITDTSNVGTIFNTLLQRSKGLSDKDLGVIYSAILNLGVTKVRKHVEGLPNTLTPNEVFSNVATYYQNHAAPVSQIKFYSYLLLYHGVENVKNHDNYSLSELAVMVACLANCKPESLEDLHLTFLHQQIFSDFAEESFDCHTNFDRVVLSDEGIRAGFTDFIEFKAFIAYCETALSELIEVLPVFIDPDKTPINEGVYRLCHCISPYNLVRNGEKDEFPL